MESSTAANTHQGNYATTVKPKFVDRHLSCNGLQATTVSTINELADEVPCGVHGMQVTA